MNTDEQAVATALKTYERALNASQTDAVMPLYAPDGVFMPQNSPSSVGIDAIRKAYDAVFSAITLKVEFKLAEVRQLAPDWVLARTNSAGTVTIHATGQTASEANQELFVFQKVGGDWKISRYCFATTNPPGAPG
ncbi:MAG: SgcJ/EcaC family oxidoreductase [Solirubrobacterales bacterium]|nr:SgcJ/EcaC family oxidoreductase [Solirubrobacterales bacterium]